MSKERLEEWKLRKELALGTPATELIFEEMFLFIEEQAELLQESEKDKKAIIKTANIIDDRNQKLEQQNKRYREAIDSMRLHAHYPELIKQIYEVLEESE